MENDDSSHIRDAVMKLLRSLGNDKHIPTPDIRKQLRRNKNFPKFTKRDLNRVLYSLKDDEEIISDHGSPPRWSEKRADTMETAVKRIKIQSSEEEIVYVLVDADNKPYCFVNAAALSTSALRVIGFAACQYNFFNPNETKEYCELVQSKTSMKDVAEIEMCAHAVQICEQAADLNRIQFILVSGDKSVFTIAHVLSHYGVDVQTLTSWDELKLEIE